ncbi:endolytic transglycosylase MltG [bacterium]|nr:endolytic transglycosylase MltG [bacterium]
MIKKILISIILLVGFLMGTFYVPVAPFSQEEIVFIVKRGESSKEIAMNLEKEGLIFWAPIFRSYVFMKGISGKLKAGSYLLSRTMSLSEIAEKFVKGEVIKEKIVIPEGWNLRDIAFYFERKGMFQAAKFWELVGFPAIDYSKTTDLPKIKDFSSEYDFLRDKPKNVSLEGYLFPDTYEISKDITLEEIVRKMLDNFDKKLTPTLREEIKNQKKSIFEIVTMASLLEKEVKTKEDKEIVSGILWKRLENKIPLQVDATITYITGKRTTKISKEETQIDSPYNTYKYLGLPLGPICNPGLESILAALHPKNSEYWYYLSTPEGKTIFSKTLKEHNIAKAKYLK